MTVATIAEAARAALCETGRPDLAGLVGTNKAGHPTRGPDVHTPTDAALVAKAFALAHGEPFTNGDWVEWVGMLQSPLRDDLGIRHWSPARQAWGDTYDPAEWIGVSL